MILGVRFGCHVGTTYSVVLWEGYRWLRRRGPGNWTKLAVGWAVGIGNMVHAT